MSQCDSFVQCAYVLFGWLKKTVDSEGNVNFLREKNIIILLKGLSILTRAAVLQPPASGWAGILHGLAAHSRSHAGCVRNTRMGGPELHAPQGPRATGFYALHRCRRSSTSSRRERARDEWAVSGGPSRVRASLPQKSLDKRLRFKLSQRRRRRRREASIPATKAGNLYVPFTWQVYV